jgi:hypothetical protein
MKSMSTLIYKKQSELVIALLGATESHAIYHYQNIASKSQPRILLNLGIEFYR